MSRAEIEQRREPRNIGDVGPDEFERYYEVPGWRIWSLNIFDSPEFREASQAAESKDLALVCHEFDRGYSQIYYKYEEAERALHPDRPRLPFGGPGSLATDQPWFLLEPLAGVELRRIDEQGEAPGLLGSIDRLNELLRPSELKDILESAPRRRF